MPFLDLDLLDPLLGVLEGIPSIYWASVSNRPVSVDCTTGFDIQTRGSTILPLRNTQTAKASHLGMALCLFGRLGIHFFIGVGASDVLVRVINS